MALLKLMRSRCVLSGPDMASPYSCTSATRSGWVVDSCKDLDNRPAGLAYLNHLGVGPCRSPSV